MENNSNNSEIEEINIKDILFKYLAFWTWFLVGVILSLAVAYTYLRYQSDIYQTTAKIKILDSSKGGMRLPSDVAALFSNSKVNLDNEMEVLKSHRLLELVAKNLNLETTYYVVGNIITSELWKDKPFKVVWLDAKDTINTKKISFEIELQPKGYKIISGNSKSEELFQFGQKNKIQNQEFILVLDTTVAISKLGYTNFKVVRTPLYIVVESLSSALQLAATAKQSEVLSLQISGENQDKSEAIINEIIDKFNEDGVIDRQLVSQRTIDFVNERFINLSGELDSIENQKKTFKTENDLSYLPEDARVTITKKSLTEGDYYALETQIALAKLLEDTLKKDGQFELLPSNIGIENQNINDLIADYNKVVLDRGKLLVSAGVKNPMVVEYSEKIVELKQNVLSSIRVLQKQLAVAINNVKSLKQENSSTFSSIPAKEKILRSIERQQTIKETLYLFLLQKREEAAVSKAVTSPSIKVVDYAMTNYIPIAPKRSIIYLAALLIGLLIPFSIVYIIFLTDTKIHSKLDFERLSPTIPVVAEIPFIEEDTRIIIKNDRSVLAESFRILRTNINYLIPIKNEGECPVIYTSSSIKGEGKTFVSLNLALTFASMDKKVLLLGSDLRNPQLHKYLKLNKNRTGLTNYLYDSTTDRKDLINEKVFNNDYLSIIFAGSVPPNPAELLSNGRFEELLNILKKEYDYIIVDTAPTILVTDTLLISQLADITVYVTRADHTDKKLLTYSKGLKDQSKMVNMAYVINNVGGEKGYGYGYGYGYKYSYGYTYGYNYGYGYGYGEDSEDTKPRKKNVFRWIKKRLTK
jgi:capsular exopolysaccharide synthesis family protein